MFAILVADSSPHTIHKVLLSAQAEAVCHWRKLSSSAHPSSQWASKNEAEVPPA